MARARKTERFSPPRVIRGQATVCGYVYSFKPCSWRAVRAKLPHKLDPEAENRLQHAIQDAVSELYSQTEGIRLGAMLAALMQSPGKGQRSPLQRLAQGLRNASDASAAMCRIGEERVFGDVIPHLLGLDDDDDTAVVRLLCELASAAEELITFCSSFEKLRARPPAWREFVRDVEKCLRGVGLKPTGTGNLYDEAHSTKPSWFQEFMISLNSLLPQEIRERSTDNRALAAKVAKAMRGDR